MAIFIKATRLLVQHYFILIPRFLAFYLFFGLIFTFIPGFGWLLAMPLSVGVAYATSYIVLGGDTVDRPTLFLGYEGNTTGKNFLFLTIKWGLVLLAVSVLTAPIFRLLGPYLVQYFDSDIVIVLLSLVVSALLPAFIVTTLFAMTPFLLADPKFDQRVRNPLTTSMKMIKGHYGKLVLLRLIFIPWFLWLLAGGILMMFVIVAMAFSGEVILGDFVRWWLISVPVTLFVVLPWYHMVHTVLYAELRETL